LPIAIRLVAGYIRISFVLNASGTLLLVLRVRKEGLVEGFMLEGFPAYLCGPGIYSLGGATVALNVRSRLSHRDLLHLAIKNQGKSKVPAHLNSLNTPLDRDCRIIRKFPDEGINFVANASFEMSI
jgi:hypothetical protein